MLPVDVYQVLGKSDVRTTSGKVAGVGPIVPRERWKCPAFLSGASRGVRHHQGSSDRRGKCILTEKAREPDPISSSSSTFSIEKVVFKVISLLANMPLMFCLLTEDPASHLRTPAAATPVTGSLSELTLPEPEVQWGSVLHAAENWSCASPQSTWQGSLCYREFHLCDELSHFETAGFVVSPF